MNTEDAKALAESALDTLTAQLEAGHSASLTNYLASMARFHRYSLNNILLIHSQRQRATHVAGFSAWRELGRFVRRGEKGIAILVPMTCRKRGSHSADGADPDDVQAARAVLGYKPGYVFDGLSRDSDHEYWSYSR